MEIATVGVVGCGQMGSGIVETVARAGYQVRVTDLSPEVLERGLGRVKDSVQRGVARGKLSDEEATSALARVTGVPDLAAFSACDLVIEAVVENAAEKRRIFAALDGACPPHALLVSNTSSLAVIEMAAATGRPDRVAGLHFFNPVPVMNLVEIVRTIASSDETIDHLRAFAATLGKQVIMSRDAPGFIVNRLLIPYLLSAIAAYEQGVASREDLDTGMVLGCGHPMGPLTLADFIGLDTVLFIADAMFEETRDRSLAAPPLLRRMVTAGYLGRKSGRGFYEYS